jgi:predicted NACHT family NTPase
MLEFTPEIEDSLKSQRLGGDANKRRRQVGLTPIDSITQSSGGFSLVGTHGSGKTTIFRSIAVQAARGTYIRGRKRIPIYLAVRDLAISKQGIPDAAESLLKQLEVGEAARVLEALLKSGNCIILLDGLDETTCSGSARWYPAWGGDLTNSYHGCQTVRRTHHVSFRAYRWELLRRLS